MKRIGVYCRKDVCPERAAKELIEWLERRGYEVFIFPFSEENLDLVIVLGGDGSLLHVARAIWPKKIPILGINWGNVGFLTAVNKNETYPMLERVFKKEFEIRKRMTLEATISSKQDKGPFMALNEVVIERGSYTHLITLSVDTAGQPVISLRADGLIVATPTGSTAYSLSTGGPVVYPTLDALIISSICPFYLAHRSLVLPPDHVVGVRVERGGDGVRVVFDGQLSFPLQVGDRVEIKKSLNPIYLIENEKFFETLNQKLCWGC